MAKYKLGDIAPIQQGSVPESESYWLLNLDMVESNTGHIYERLYVPFDKIGTSTIAFDTNNVLYSKLRPYLNKVVIPDCPGYATSEMLPLKPKKNYITREYLTYFLRSPKFVAYINEKTSGAKMPRANSSDLKSVEIECPTLENQRHITSEFDRIISIVRLRQQQLQKLDELVKARFVEMFGDPEKNTLSWKEEELSEHLTVIGGYAFKSEQFSEEGIPVLRIGNINSGFFKPVNLVYWEDDNTLNRYKMYPGDLVMSLTGTVGKDDYGNVCILGNDYDVYYLNQRNAKLELQDTINKYYLSMLLKFEPVKKKLTGISRGVRQANISNKDILNLMVPIPPIELQNQFAAFVEQTDKSKVAVQKALDEAQLLFDSLMQKYFG